jgi:hypothetical protein
MARELSVGWRFAGVSAGRFAARAIRETTDWGEISSFGRQCLPNSHSRGWMRKCQTPSGKSSEMPYPTNDIATQVFATRYRISRPDVAALRQEILEIQRAIETRAAAKKALP